MKVRIQIFRLLFLVSLLPGIGQLWAQSDLEQTSFGDHPLIDRFPDSEIDSLVIEEDVNYRLVLGTLQRTRGVVAPEESRRLKGDVTKIIYEVSPEFSGEDVYQFFYEQMRERGYTELFSCSGRACGSSNYWANDIFSNRVLYGPERNQYFLAMQAGDDEELSPHISLYIITRGNRRLYAYLEIIEENLSRAPVSLVAPELLESLNTRGSVNLTDLEFVSDAELAEGADLEAVVNLLASEPNLRVYLVAHLAGSQPLTELIRRSRARAVFLRDQLIALGVDGDRIIAEGVGPLAPACAESTNCAERVELVLR